MVLVFADAADIAIEHSVPGAEGLHCARCGAPRTPIWSAAGHQAMVVSDLASDAIRS
jgi:hypothetical protein